MGIQTFVKKIIQKRELNKALETGAALTQAGVTSTTPQTTTGAYVTPSGTVTVNKGTVTTTPTPTPSPVVHRGGGGSSSTVSTTPTVNQVNNQTALDIPTPSYQGTVTKATSTTGVRNAVNYFTSNIGRESAGQLFKGTGQIAAGGIVNRIKKETARDKAYRENLINQETQNLQTGTRTTSLYGGTTQTYQGAQYTDAEVVKLGQQQKVSETAVINELSRRDAVRYGDEYNTFINTKVPEIQSKAQEEYQTRYNQLNAQVQKGLVSVDEANRILKDTATKVNTDIEKQLEVQTKGWTDSRGLEFQKESNVRLNKISDKIKISKTLAIAPLIVAGGFALGAGGVALASLGAGASAVVTTAGVVGTGAAVVGTGSSLLSSYKTGTLNAGRVGAVILPQLLFIGGAYGGAKITGKAINNYNINKLNGALDRANLEVVNPKAITKDFQITTLKIPENAQVEILGKLRGGNSIRVVEYSKENIKGANAEDVKTIKKLLPETKAKFVEVIDSYGNVIQRIAVGEIKVGTGKTAYRENVLQGSSGLKVGENIVMDTINLRAPEGKGFTEVAKTREVIKPNQAKYFMEDNALKRLVGSSSFSFEGIKIKAPEGKQITFKNLQEAINFNKFNKVASAKSKSAEIQRVTEISRDNAVFGVEGGQNTLAWDLKQIKFQTEGGKAVTNKIPKPLEYIKTFEGKSKPWDLTQDINMKNINKNIKPEQPKTSSTSQILEQKPVAKVQGFDLGQLPSFDFTPQIKTAVKSGVNKVITAKKFPSLFVLPVQQQGQLSQKAIFSQNQFKTQNNINQNQLQMSKNQLQLSNKELDILSKNQLQLINLDFEKVKNKNKQQYVQKLESLNIFQTPQLKTNMNIIQLMNQNILQQQKQIQNLIQPQKLQQQQITSQIFKPYVPFVPIPINPIIFPPLFPSFQQGGGYQTNRRFLTRNKKATPKYTASLSSAAFGTKPLKVTKQQIEKLNRVVFSGAEARPTLQLISDEEMNKQLKKVNF
jgi:hypothetical protein